MLYKILAFALITAVLCIFLKSENSQFFLPVLIAGGTIVALFSVSYLTQVVQAFNELADLTGTDNGWIVLCVKVTAIGYIVEFVCGAIEDCGLKSLSDKVALAGRLVILCMSIPVFLSLVKLIASFVGRVL